MKQFLNLIMSLNTVSAKKIADVKIAKAGAYLKTLNQRVFASYPDRNFQERGMEQVWQVLRAYLAVAISVEKEPRVHEIYYTLFHV